MSGGPAVDATGRVLGVIATGVPTDAASETTDDHVIIPMSVLRAWRRAVEERGLQHANAETASGAQP